AHTEIDQFHIQNGGNVSANKVVVRLISAAHAAVSFISILKKAMEKRDMNRVYVSLMGLQVIALMKDLSDVDMVWRRFEKFIIRKQRSLTRSHVGENHSSRLPAGISEMANMVPMFTPARLSRLLQTSPFNVVEPTMIKTAEPAILDSPVAEVRSSVRAVNPQKAGAPLIIAEQNQLFAENLYSQRSRA